MTDAEIDAFLTRYAATLTDFNSQAAASLWATPGTISTIGSQAFLGDRDAMAQGLERSYPCIGSSAGPP